MTATNNSADQPREEDRSYEDQYAGRGTFVDDDALPYGWKKTKAKVDREPEPEQQQPPRQERRSCTNSSPRAPPDPDEALAFLKALRRDAPWVLTAIVPDGATTTRTFEARDEDGVRKFIEINNATKNIYFTGNPCGRPSKKPTKADMTGAIFLHTDDDPREGETPEVAKKRILAGYDAHDPPPSIVIDSGNGLQGIWLLDVEYQFPEKGKVEEIELRNRALAARLGTTPGTHNVDRLLRLPGTVNIPNEAKRKKGRVECPASIVRMTYARYQLGSFKKAEEKAKAEEKEKSSGAEELSQSLRALLYIPDPGAGNPAGGYEDRSALMFAFVTMALRKVNGNVIVRACLDPAHRGHAIYEHCIEKGGAEYLERQIDRAREEIKKASPSLIIGIARRLWGEATSQQGDEHRFGTRIVNARSGWWYDFDACEGGSLRELMRKAAARARAADVPTPTLRWHGDADPLRDIKWLIQDLLPETAFGSLSGQWGTYKTFVALDIAASVMTEQQFLRFPTRRRGGVLFIAAEGAYTIGVRLQAVVEAKCGDAKRLPFTWLDASPLLLDSGAVDALVKISTEVDAKMRAEHGVPLVLIIIDTIAVAAGYEERGDENDMTIGTRITATMSNLAGAKRTLFQRVG